MATTSTSARWEPLFLSILRLVAGLLFLEHGTAKILGFPAGVGPHIGFNVSTMVGLSGVLEFVGGILLVVGLFTRISAFILSGEMAVAYFKVHLPHHSFYPAVNKGEIAVLYCFVFLYLAVAGGGSFSVDNLRHKA